MKRFISNILTGVVGVASAACLWSCSDESPFDADGVGTVHLRTVVNSITTRAEDDADAADRDEYLRQNCVVYISGDEGLVYKEKGLDNVSPAIPLKTGHYVAEAWSGDSVTASFDKMFFRGYQPFDVTKGSESNVVVNCQIRNVVVSVNTASINTELIQDYNIKVRNTRGDLEFDTSNAGTDRGYFMMPNGDSNLEYDIEVVRIDGQTFTKSGKIENVQSAHHYILNFTYDNMGSTGGSAGYVFFEIKIKDENLSNSVVTVPSAPTVSGVDFDADKQLVALTDESIPDELALKICGFGDGLDEIMIDPGSNFAFNDDASTYQKSLVKGINILKAQSDNPDNYHHAGITWVNPKYNATTNVSTAYLKFSKDFISHLSARDTEHVINVKVTDVSGRTTVKPIRIARADAAIVYEDPVVLKPLDTDANPMALSATSASLTFTLGDSYEGQPGVEYRKDGDPDTSWTFVAANVPAAAPRRAPWKAPSLQSMTITGLEPGTTYQYRACCGDFHAAEVFTLTTESKFEIPNASFEEWSTYSAKTLLGNKTVILPGGTGDKETSFWGSGNEGAATANKTLTTQSSDMFHSGSSSARLASSSAMGIIAAGNIFVGKYQETDGTNGVLSLGREYNGSHPAKVRVYANYRPGGGVSIKSGNEGYVDDLVSGGTDQGQIYVALVVGNYEVRTNPSKRRLFDKNDPQVLAYGQVTWKEAFGPDGQLQMLEIPFEYNDRAYTEKPTHLVIVCSASKFGDYFCGSDSSVMYVDDFELVY